MSRYVYELYRVKKQITKSKILIRFGSSSYIANPMLFGKGEWLSIRKIRLTVEYDFELGTKEFTAETETETNKVEHEIEELIN